MENKDYTELVKEHIELDKILYKTKPEYREKVKALLEEKQKVIDKNSIFANHKLNKINKQIEKYIQK